MWVFSNENYISNKKLNKKIQKTKINEKHHIKNNEANYFVSRHIKKIKQKTKQTKAKHGLTCTTNTNHQTHLIQQLIDSDN